MSLPHTPSRDERADAAIADWLEAEEEGRAFDRHEFLARHPEIAGELQMFFADRHGFRRLAAKIVPVENAPSPSPAPEPAAT